MRKYADTGRVTILSPEDQEKIASNLRTIGKTSARGLTDEERARALDTRSTK